MVELFGRKHARMAIGERTGALQQVAGVELLEYADGPERGVRVLEFRTGAGLSFRVALDRGFDLLAAEYQGIPIGWRSPTGPRHPGLASPEENRGWGFLRSFTGLLATCGLDQALAPATASAERYIYPGFTETDYPLHGRISQIPARLVGYGERWQGDACTLWAEGEVAQTAVFGENLVLTRRIEAALGGTAITVSDQVENRGFRPTPHMLLYHYNFGWPLLDAGAELLVPSRAIVHTVHADLHAQGVGYRIQGPPTADFSEQVYEHDVVAAADGMAPALLINPGLGAGGFGIRLEWDRAALPCLIQWQCLQSGLYVLGIEPSTNHVLGRKFAEARGELTILEHGETRHYRTRLTMLDGAAAIAAARHEVEALHAPPADFTPPTGEFPNLGARP
ncbi:MAG: aldose 1-epimerase family protein [Geminicoccaceae bacterium]